MAILICADTASASPTIIRTQSGDQELYSDSYALIIAESKYRRADDAHWNPLEAIPKETKNLIAALQQLGFEKTKIEVHEDVVSGDLPGVFVSFIKAKEHQDPTARLFIYYAGHGATDTDLHGYLVPVDAPDQTSPDFYSKVVPMVSVRSILELAHARHTLVVFDSCFSGSVLETREGLVPVPNLRLESLMRQGVMVVTAGTADQKVPSESEFLQALIRGAEGAADGFNQGYVTGVQLSEYLKSHVLKTSPHDGVIMGDSSGQIVFVPSPTGPGPFISNSHPDIGITTNPLPSLNTYVGDAGTFLFSASYWYFKPVGSPENGGVRLVKQAGGDQKMVLWDPKGDNLYEIPIGGGAVRIRTRDVLSWSDFGIFRAQP